MQSCRVADLKGENYFAVSSEAVSLLDSMVLLCSISSTSE